jgi:hypothetical protein
MSQWSSQSAWVSTPNHSHSWVGRQSQPVRALAHIMPGPIMHTAGWICKWHFKRLNTLARHTNTDLCIVHSYLPAPWFSHCNLFTSAVSLLLSYLIVLAPSYHGSGKINQLGCDHAVAHRIAQLKCFVTSGSLDDERRIVIHLHNVYLVQLSSLRKTVMTSGSLDDERGSVVHLHNVYLVQLSSLQCLEDCHDQWLTGW